MTPELALVLRAVLLFAVMAGLERYGRRRQARLSDGGAMCKPSEYLTKPHENHPLLAKQKYASNERRQP